MRIYICAYLNKFVKTKDKRPTPLSSVGSTSSGSKDPCDCKIPPITNKTANTNVHINRILLIFLIYEFPLSFLVL